MGKIRGSRAGSYEEIKILALKIKILALKMKTLPVKKYDFSADTVPNGGGAGDSSR